ncbi:MAG: LuxR C-terminal-related transcriptional regulator [Phycisphaerae bacterium]|nr:LuxR C-terminal-related transcriptional regulator [Phycisphaerae bacterium]
MGAHDPINDPVFRSLAADPSTGVVLFRFDGTVLFGNDQAARIFMGPGARAADYIGRNYRDWMPPAYVASRDEMHRELVEQGKPMLIRALWNGFQHVTWLQFIPDVPDGGRAHDPAAGRFLAITRRVEGNLAERITVAGEFVRVDSDQIRLGDLDVLTPRELEVLALIGQNLASREIASLLGCAEKTIEKHRESIGAKLKVAHRAQLADLAQRAGLTLEDASRARV